MSRHLVLSAKPYDFENTKGEKISGVRIAYVNKKPSTREGEYGHPPLITTCSIDVIKDSRLEELPAIFDLDFEQVTGKNNKPEIILTEMNYISSVDMSLFFDN